MASISPAEWTAVTRWTGTVTAEFERKASDSRWADTWSLQGAWKLDLKRSSQPSWEGSFDYSATYSSFIHIVTPEGKVLERTEQGSATETAPVHLLIDEETLDLFLDPIMITTVIKEADGSARQGTQNAFPPNPSVPYAKLPGSISVISDLVEHTGAVDGGAFSERSEWKLEPADLAKSKTAKVWINAFIPRDLPGVTVPVPAGPHSAKTMLKGPIALVNDCFLTDQRAASPDIGAASRIHSEIEVNLFTGKVVQEFHRCFPTVEVDCEDGEVECEKEGSVDQVRVTPFLISDVNGPGALSLR